MKNLIVIFLMTSFHNSYSQMTISQMANLPFDENYKLHEQKLKSNFKNKPKFWKGDIDEAFSLEYKSVQFDDFGKADLTFKYFQNKLTSAEVRLEILKDKFYQIKNIRNLFEDKITSKYKLYEKNIILGDIDYTLKEIENCSEKGGGDYSQNKSLYYKRWNFDNPIKENSKLISNGMYLYSNGIICCRVEIVFNFTRLDLFQLESKSKNKIYKAEDEYSKKEIELKETNGVYILPITLNNNLTLDFVLDLGAADVSISQDVFSVLTKAGSIDQSDFIGEQNYQLADGTIVKSQVINLRSLKIGELEIKNVRASISNSTNSPLLLGQSALKRLGKYQIDNDKLLLSIE